MPTKNLEDFCPGSLLEGRAEIIVIFGWHFGRTDDLINKFILNLADLHISTSSKFPHRKTDLIKIKIPIRKADGVRIPILKAIYLTYPGCLLKIMAGSSCDIFFSQYQFFSCSTSHEYINICQEFLSVLEETIFLWNESCVPT